MNMEKTADFLLKQHGGKTVTISVGSIVMLAIAGAQAGWLPTPATQDFVRAEITQATKGLEYLVRKELETDLDVLNYVITCMRDARQFGALRRLEDQYEELFNESYQHKSCQQLEADPRVATGVSR